jgi:CubicO group peptidase (beta-lactamase class C family)
MSQPASVRSSHRPGRVRLLGLGLGVCLAAVCLQPVGGQVQQVAPAPAPAAKVFPGADWERVASPESVGYSSARLEALRGWLRSLDTTAMFVSVGGRSLFEYGDLTHLSYLASVRKSVLSIVYGKYVENGTIPLGRTLRELEFTDVGGLMPAELEATIEDVITARSGVYHPASNSGDDTASAPPRGSQRHGTYQLYNNWDFNAAGAIFEKLTGRVVYDAVETDLARPIGMQDFDRARQRKSGDVTRSQYQAYHMWFSVRDMARIGLLMLREGEWAGKPVASREWTRRIISLVTPLNEMNPPRHRALGTGLRWGYGYMWWVWDAPQSPGPYRGAYTGIGAGGQYITVLPELDMVVAHKTDLDQPPTYAAATKRRRTVTGTEYDSILRMVIAAKCPGGRCEGAAEAAR